jgi:NRAMP (natural resistance-associated macrophage protein)-like metal ion transporter
LSRNPSSAKAARRALVLQGRFRRFFSNLGPGLITGAADDDPSGISTYSVTGAGFGYAPLWTAVFSFPLMAAIQIMSARLGMVTGLGLAGVIRRHYPRWILWSACGLLVVANIVNIAADLGGMADVTALLTGVRPIYWRPLYAIILVGLLFWTSYRLIARIFKWLTLALFAYIGAAFLAHPDWGAVMRATLIPTVQWTGAYWATLVGILGTTISPYLFFWQAAQEVEQDISLGRATVEQREGATNREIRVSRTDVLTGMFFSNLVMYFIILTSAATLHAHGQTTISTARDAAEALRPLAGAGAYWLFSLGLIGAGMLGVPVLAGSCAYAIAEAADWARWRYIHPERTVSMRSSASLWRSASSWTTPASTP